MEFIKSVETINFRLVFDSPEHAKVLNGQSSIDPKTPVSVKVFGNSDDGLKFCASKDAIEMVKPLVSKKPLPQLIRGYELAIPMAKHMGYLNTPAVVAASDARHVPLASPPSYSSGTTPSFESKNPFNPSATDIKTTAEMMATPVRPALDRRSTSLIDFSKPPANK